MSTRAKNDGENVCVYLRMVDQKAGNEEVHRAAAAAAIVTVAGLFAAPGAVVSGQTDLDAFMQQVLARRDDNWKKLQQYILDEREQIELRGPSGRRLWGEQRDFTWYLRDGFFVRSPVRSASRASRGTSPSAPPAGGRSRGSR